MCTTSTRKLHTSLNGSNIIRIKWYVVVKLCSYSYNFIYCYWFTIRAINCWWLTIFHDVWIPEAGINQYLVRGTFTFVDDANVRSPSDDERHKEVNNAGGQHMNGVETCSWIAFGSSKVIRAHIRPYEHRDIERHIVDPQAHDDSGGYVHFESRSTELAYSQESTQQYSCDLCIY